MPVDLSEYEEAAERYAPSETRVLFVAESPPASIDRYFYYPDVREHDQLWLGMMKALYRREFGEARDERPHKHFWLKRFQADGYRLIDAVKEPGPTAVEAIRGNAARVIDEIQEVDPQQVVLIKATVYDGLFNILKHADIPVVNQGKLPFPGSGQQRNFRDRFRELVESGRLRLTRC